MARNISIAIAARDNFSSAISTMRNANQHFNKDLEGLQQKLNALNRTKTTLKLDAKSARRSLQELEKEYLAAKKSGDGMVSDELLRRLQDANDEYETARRNLDLVSRSARDAERSMANYSSEANKAENRAASAQSEVLNEQNSMLKSLAAAGVTKMLGDFGAQAAGVYLGSAYGDNVSSMFSSILSGATSGAAAGTMMGGAGTGTAIGAAAGSVLGLAQGATQQYQKEDEAFKTIRNQLIDDQTSRIQTDISAGSGIAAQRETDSIAFSKLMKKSVEAKYNGNVPENVNIDEVATEMSESYLAWTKDTANNTPLLYDDLKKMSKTLATYGYSPEEMQERLIQIGDTGSALGMNTADMSMVATALGRMKSSGKTSLEYLNLLVERGIPAIDYLAESMGATNAEVYDMVSKGIIPGAQAADALADAMGEANSGSMEAMSKTFSGLTSTIEGLNQEMQNAYGEGYNAERMKSLRSETYHLSGESGERAEEGNKAIGAYYASLDNEKDRLRRRAETLAYIKIDEMGIDREGAEAGKILMEARAKAAAEYNASEGAQQEFKMQEQLIGDVASKLVEDKTYWNAGYLLGQEQSKGMAAAIGENANVFFSSAKARYDTGELTEEEYYEINPLGDYEVYKEAHSPDAAYAYGMNYVPYNNFPALLHEGERVLTASEARSLNNDASVTITGNNFTVREEADIYKIAQELARELRNAAMLSQ